MTRKVDKSKQAAQEFFFSFHVSQIKVKKVKIFCQECSEPSILIVRVAVVFLLNFVNFKYIENSYKEFLYIQCEVDPYYDFNFNTRILVITCVLVTNFWVHYRRSILILQVDLNSIQGRRCLGIWKRWTLLYRLSAAATLLHRLSLALLMMFVP